MNILIKTDGKYNHFFIEDDTTYDYLFSIEKETHEKVYKAEKSIPSVTNAQIIHEYIPSGDLESEKFYWRENEEELLEVFKGYLPEWTHTRSMFSNLTILEGDSKGCKAKYKEVYGCVLEGINKYYDKKYKFLTSAILKTVAPNDTIVVVRTQDNLEFLHFCITKLKKK